MEGCEDAPVLPIGLLCNHCGTDGQVIQLALVVETLYVFVFSIYFQHMLLVDKRDDMALATEGYFLKLSQVCYV